MSSRNFFGNICKKSPRASESMRAAFLFRFSDLPFLTLRQNIAFMLPTGLLYKLVSDLMTKGTLEGTAPFYIIGCVIAFALILFTTWFQYNGTYFTTYKESGIRRLTLAERHAPVKCEEAKRYQHCRDKRT